MDCLFLDFANSRLRASRGDDPLQNPNWVNDLAERWQSPKLAGLSPDDTRQLVTLRGLLVDATLALAAGGELSNGQVDQLNGYLATDSLHYTLVKADAGYSAELTPTTTGLPGLTADIARSFVELIAQHDPSRLRECENPDCHWLFYDDTRNASRKWCCGSCASLIKVRRFRQRHKS